MLLAHSLDQLLNPSAMRLVMGELSFEELQASQASARQALEVLAEHGWSVGDKVAPEGLLHSMAVRLDHALAVPGYYDQEFMGGQPGDQEKRLASTVALARRVHEAFVATAPAFPGALVDKIQADLDQVNLPAEDPVRLSAFAAVRYALRNAPRHGLVLLPQQAPEELLSLVFDRVPLKDWPVARLLPEGAEQELKRQVGLDIQRLYEETVGTGFFHPGWSLTSLAPPRRPKP